MGIVRKVASRELRPADLLAIRETVWSAFAGDPEAFTEDDWEHALGGVHFVLEERDVVVAHASVVERELHTGQHRLAVGYVEAVATEPAYQRRGYGSAVMREVGEFIDRTCVLGALDTGSPGFYERLGWVAWEGPTFVRTESGLIRTEEDDGNVMVRLTPTSPKLDLSAAISCEWRFGDVW